MPSVLYKSGDGLRDNKIRGMRWCGRSSHVRRRLLSSRLIPETGPGSGFHTAWTPQCCLGPLSGAGAGLAGTDAERLTPRPQYIAWANIVAYAPWRVIATALLGRVRGCLTRAAAFLEAASLQPRAVRGITSALYRPWPESLAGVEEPALLAPRPSVCAQTTQMRERGLCRWVRLLLCRHALRG